ncbi:bifunctional folylpolyglutamate synthase/dihydrofolate synthase [Companilactobacillus metriopterae]|uniref:bifunctional folylpolyglutamate synthase/dihydrofolate synthase n=1 Tax=Companilactobacillus metriopterae TaxID=1909267 RepID=UPI00100A4BBE|nr:Mur ligase family protein [Companilactobacillus metriopterae]
MFKTSDEAVEYIHSLPKFHESDSLDFIKLAMQKLGNPQDSYKIVHITGTNGKGTTTNYLANLLEASNLRVGMFISPFIKIFNERIQINHEYISNDDLCNLSNYIVAQTKGIELTEFEFVTALGLLYFKDRVDIAVVEVGIGGKRDKTNIVKPVLSIITSVGMDHENIIGPTLLDIAREKSGIIKQNTPVILGLLDDDVSHLIEKVADQKDSSVYQFEREFNIENFRVKDIKINFDFKNGETYPVSILGIEKTTAINAAMAIEAFYLLNKEHDLTDEISEIESHPIPGRMQVVRRDPLVIFDGAHNFAAIDNLTNSLTKTWPNKDIIVLYSGMKDKKRDVILSNLSKYSKKVYITQLKKLRSAGKEDYDLSSYSNVEFVDDYRDFYSSFIDEQTSDQIFLVTGSFYLVSDLLNTFVI